MKALLAALCLMALETAHAEIPEPYKPMVVSASASGSLRVFDLTAAFDKARQLHKPIFIYLGAADCPACKQYSLFLEQHEKEMRPLFAKVVLVDIRASVRGPKPVFQIHGTMYSTADFKALVGDTDPDLPYPTWWLLTEDGKQVRQLPRGVNHFTKVKLHAHWLSQF